MLCNNYKIIFFAESFSENVASHQNKKKTLFEKSSKRTGTSQVQMINSNNFDMNFLSTLVY